MNIRKKKSQELAAAKAGISERSARRIEGAVMAYFRMICEPADSATLTRIIRIDERLMGCPLICRPPGCWPNPPDIRKAVRSRRRDLVRDD